MESSEEIRQKVDLLALAAQWKVKPPAPLPSARSGDDLGTACLALVHTARKGAKSSRGPNPRMGNALSPLGTARKQLFLSEPIPKPEKGGSPQVRRPEASPGDAPAAAQQGPAGEVPRRPAARRPAAVLVQVLATRVCPLLVPQVHGLRRSEGAVSHLPFELLPHGCKGSAVEGRRERRSELPRAAGLPESRAPPPPPRLAAESTAEEPARAGRRAGRGRCRQTGRGRAGLRPHLTTWEPGLPETRQWGLASKNGKEKEKTDRGRDLR